MMSNETPGDWLTRKRTEFGSFDLSSLNFVGWLLFLSTLIPLGVGVLIIVQSTNHANPGGNDFESRATNKVFAILVGTIMIGWFQGGKLLLNRLGVSIYRSRK